MSGPQKPRQADSPEWHFRLWISASLLARLAQRVSTPVGLPIGSHLTFRVPEVSTKFTRDCLRMSPSLLARVPGGIPSLSAFRSQNLSKPEEKASDLTSLSLGIGETVPECGSFRPVLPWGGGASQPRLSA